MYCVTCGLPGHTRGSHMRQDTHTHTHKLLQCTHLSGSTEQAREQQVCAGYVRNAMNQPRVCVCVCVCVCVQDLSLGPLTCDKDPIYVPKCVYTLAIHTHTKH